MPIVLLDERDKEELQEQINGKVGKDEFEELSDPNRHAKYFDITEDGILSLKTEYRGASDKSNRPYSVSDMGVGVVGSKNAELPTHLVMPEIVGGIAVDSVVDAIFYRNEAINIVTFPKTIKVIPAYCFQYTRINKIINTEQVVSMGANSCQGTFIKTISFPNLTTMGSQAFAYCVDLTHLNIGKVTIIPARAFMKCNSLSRLDCEATITTIKEMAFQKCFALRNIDFTKNVTSIEKGAFIGCTYEPKATNKWDSLTGCTFGHNATSKQYNATDFWSNLRITESENPLPTIFSQWYSGVLGKYIGNTGYKWHDNGCVLFSVMHAYSGLHNEAFASVDDFEAKMKQRYGNDCFDTFVPDVDQIEVTDGGLDGIATKLGLSVENYTEFNATTLQRVYDALAEGKYVVTTIDGGLADCNLNGHAAMIYGLTADGKFKIADPSYKYMVGRESDIHGSTYTVSYHVMFKPSDTNYSRCYFGILDIAE